jgi:hypothetical protein
MGDAVYVKSSKTGEWIARKGIPADARAEYKRLYGVGHEAAPHRQDAFSGTYIEIDQGCQQERMVDLADVAATNSRSLAA